MKYKKFLIVSTFLLSVVQPVLAETLILACNVAFSSCPSGNCVRWKPVFTIDASRNTITSNNHIYTDEETTYTDVRINSKEMKFNRGGVVHIINRITAEMTVDMSETKLARNGNMYGKCERGSAQF